MNDTITFQNEMKLLTRLVHSPSERDFLDLFEVVFEAHARNDFIFHLQKPQKFLKSFRLPFNYTILRVTPFLISDEVYSKNPLYTRTA